MKLVEIDRSDPRWYQIISLSLLLAYGLVGLHFDVRIGQVAVILTTACLTQALFTRAFRLPFYDPKSALISGLSLCLLLRTNYYSFAVLGAVIAVGSKFLLRLRGKHVFNPTNLALGILLWFCSDCAWVSPGQWGSVAYFGFLILCLGGLVIHRASRADVSLTFLLAYSGLLFGRSLWLGEPMTIPFHRVQSGSLLLFAFFMISDPKTTPNSRVARILFAILVAFGAAFVHFKLFRQNGLIWSLLFFSLLVPLLDLIFPAAGYQWQKPKKSAALLNPKLIYEKASI